VLGQRLQAAQEEAAGSAVRAARAARDLQRTLGALGRDERERRAASARLLELGRRFSDLAARHVLQDTLGLDLAALGGGAAGEEQHEEGEAPRSAKQQRRM